MLSPELTLARYAFNDDDVYGNGKPRARLFKPKRGDDLSVFDIHGMTHVEACEHGHSYADQPAKGRVHYGYAKLPYKVFTENGLKAVYDNVPPRHVSIPFVGSDEKVREFAKAIAAASGVEFKSCR